MGYVVYLRGIFHFFQRIHLTFYVLPSSRLCIRIRRDGWYTSASRRIACNGTRRSSGWHYQAAISRYENHTCPLSELMPMPRVSDLVYKRLSYFPLYRPFVECGRSDCSIILLKSIGFQGNVRGFGPFNTYVISKKCMGTETHS